MRSPPATLGLVRTWIVMNEDAPPQSRTPRVTVPASRLFAALTVARGQVQLIRRRAERSSEPDAAAIRRSADAIDHAVETLLASIHDDGEDDPGSDPDAR